MNKEEFLKSINLEDLNFYWKINPDFQLKIISVDFYLDENDRPLSRNFKSVFDNYTDTLDKCLMSENIALEIRKCILNDLRILK